MSENIDINEAFEIGESLIKKLNLDMQLLRVGYDEKKQLTFYFYSETRVDFRQLVKNLNLKLKSQIRLHQVGVRDKAKFIGGLGPCGQPLCCMRFLSEFKAITTKMLKIQNLPLNPSQFTGMCGKLMCCLSYEIPEEKREKVKKEKEKICAECEDEQKICPKLLKKEGVQETSEQELTEEKKAIKTPKVLEIPKTELPEIPKVKLKTKRKFIRKLTLKKSKR